MNGVLRRQARGANGQRRAETEAGDAGLAAAPRYRANLTCGSLRLRESRLLAALMVEQADTAAWHQALYVDNILQLGSTASIKRIAGMVRTRLASLDPSVLPLVLADERELAVQAVMAGAICESRLLADFMGIVLKGYWESYDRFIERQAWTDFVEGCRARDPEMPQWSDSTHQRVRSTVYQLLVDAGYLSDASERRLQRVTVLPPLRRCLVSTNAHAVLRCMAVNS